MAEPAERADVLLLKSENQELKKVVGELRKAVADLTRDLTKELDAGARVALETEVAELRKRDEMAKQRETELRAQSNDRERAYRNFLSRTIETIDNPKEGANEPEME